MGRNREVSNSDDIIDSRDVIARIDELESEREALTDTASEKREEFKDAAGKPYEEAAAEEIEAGDDLPDLESAILDAQAAVKEWDADNGEELKALKALADQAEGYASDWRHGEALIRDSHFEDYARQFAEDIGAVKEGASWPNNCIDWKEAAEELQQDYTQVDFDGVAYWIR